MEMPSKGEDKGKGKGKKAARDNLILFQLVALPGSNPQVDVKTWATNLSLVTHRGIFCRGPQCVVNTEYIRGVRYRCSKCSNIDFCDACVRDPSNSHPRDHILWPCHGEVVFEDWERMSAEELRDVQDFAGDIPGEYLMVPQQSESKIAAAVQRDTFSLEQLEAQLFGTNNQMDDDQLLTNWKNGIAAVRLIALLPGDPGDQLECLLTSTRLDEPEPYVVLCCDWTPGTAVEPGADIYIGEQCREIRKAAFNALNALRSRTEIKKLWVEELCVQNEQPDFKVFQERSTSLIYDRAEQTVVWAGAENEHTEAAASLIMMLSHRCDDGNLPSPAELEDDADLKEMDLLPVGSSKWQSLVEFFPPHLFTQGWLLHNVAFAKKAVVRSGEFELEWPQVARVRDMLSQSSWMGLSWRRSSPVERI